MAKKATNPWVVLVLIFFAQFMVILDATIVNVALPSIQKDLHLTEGNLQWIVNAYTLVFGGFLLLGGRAGDLLGRKRLFLIGLVIFTGASLFDGLANSEGCDRRPLAAGPRRCVISPAALSIIATTFKEGSERAQGARRMGCDRDRRLGRRSRAGWSAHAVLLLAVDLLRERPGRHRHIRALVPADPRVARRASRTQLRHRRRGHGDRRADGARLRDRRRPAGWLGLREDTRVLRARDGVARDVRRVELRTKAPLVRLSIFRIRSLLTANVAMFLAMSGMFAMFFFDTLYIQRVLGFGPLKAGIAFLPFSAGIMVSAGLASQFAPRLGVRPVAAVGFILSTAGLVLLTQLPVHGSYLTNVLPSILLSSLGMGAVFMPLTLIATTGLEDADQGLASGLFNTSQQIGGALGLAILSTLAASKTPSVGSPTAQSRHRVPLGVRCGRGRDGRGARRDGRAPALASRRQIEAAGRSGEPVAVGA